MNCFTDFQQRIPEEASAEVNSARERIVAKNREIKNVLFISTGSRNFHYQLLATIHRTFASVLDSTLAHLFELLESMRLDRIHFALQFSIKCIMH